MNYLKRPDWYLSESSATDESAYLDRRSWLKTMGIGIAATSILGVPARVHADASLNPWVDLYPVARNTKYRITRNLTLENHALTYNNFFEFGSHKAISKVAQKLKTSPWTITIDGLVKAPQQLDFDDLLKKVQLEERVYRHRCVEAWAMTVPWAGFAMSELVKIAQPLSSARYISFETFTDPKTMPGLNQPWYPWPYLEGITIGEAMNELCFIATGLYGKPIAKQNGAPLRLVLPWKYGFKSIKSIARISFTRDRPVSFWEEINAREYGFWANVNPDVPHPRWSQANERLLGEDGKVPTRIYNGYGKFVAKLYRDIPPEHLFI